VSRGSEGARDTSAAASPTGPALHPGGRLHQLDWLRAVAVLGVFFFHALHPFGTFDWHVKNAPQSESVSMLLAFLSWGLGFLFLIAGAASFLALEARTPRRYVKERLRRLFLPYVTGWLLLSPLQAYIEEVHEGTWDESYISFIPHFFMRAGRGLVNLDRDLLPLPVGWNYHLWFLLYLLWFSLLGLPLFLSLSRPFGHRILVWLAQRADWRGFPLLFALPITLLPIAVSVVFPEEHAWAKFAYYFGFFLVGYLLAADQRLLAAIHRDLGPALIAGIAGFGLLVASGAIEWAEPGMEDPSSSLPYAFAFFIFSVQAWAWALAALSLGLRLRTFARPLPKKAASAAMPFFIVHQPVILAVSFVAVGMGVTLPLKVLFVVALSFVAASGIAALGTHFRITRPLLGVKS
jgi:glucan biosynthesis protein C